MKNGSWWLSQKVSYFGCFDISTERKQAPKLHFTLAVLLAHHSSKSDQWRQHYLNTHTHTLTAIYSPLTRVKTEATYFHTLLISPLLYTSGSCIPSPCISSSSNSTSFSFSSHSIPLILRCRDVPLPIKGPPTADGTQEDEQGCSEAKEVSMPLQLVVTHFQVSKRGRRGRGHEGHVWDLVRLKRGGLDKAGSVIYVAAHIKGPCTWLFLNHYRRTINYEALFDRRLHENGTTNACLCGSGTGGRTMQPGPKQLRVFGKEATTTQTYSSAFSLCLHHLFLHYETTGRRWKNNNKTKQEIPH